MQILALRLYCLPLLSLVALALFGITGCAGQPEPHNAPTLHPVADSLNSAAVEKLAAFHLGEADTAALVEALENLRQAFSIDSTNYLYPANAAQVLMALGDPDAAVGEMTKAVSVRPTLAEGMVEIGLIRESQGRIEEARQWYEKAILAYDQRIAANLYPADPTNRAFAVRLARGREAGLQAMTDVDANADGRATVQCLIQYGSQRDFQRFVVPHLSDSGGEAASDNIQLDSCLTATIR